jgi:L-fuculose-phosphate aldolase
MKEREAAENLIFYCRKLYSKGFMPGCDGNVSVKTDECSVIITPTGVSKETIAQNDLVIIYPDGKISNGKPSSETSMHLASYRADRGIGAVIHAHSVNIGAFALAREQIETKHAPFAYIHLKEIGYVPYLTPGSPELHEAVGTELSKGHCTLLLMSHGSLVTGADLRQAYERLDLLESYAEMLIKAKLLGGAKYISSDELKKVTKG